MPTYYAQAAGAIQSVVWDTIPTGGGSTLTWPPGVGDVLVANGKALTWQAAAVPSLTCTRLTTAAEGGTDGGGFALSGSTAVAITADILAGTSKCITCTHTGTGANKVTVTGNLQSGGPGTDCYAWNHTGVGSLAVTGNCTAGSVYKSSCLFIFAASVVTVNGIATGGSADQCRGITLNSNGCSLTLTGSLQGGTHRGAPGVFVQGVSATGCLINGNVLSGAEGPGLYNNYAQPYVTVNGTVTAAGYFGIVNVADSPVTVVGSLIDSATASAVSGKLYWQPASVAHYWQVAWDGANNQRYTIPPLEGNVRLGVNYGYYGETLTGGQLHLPAATDVKLGVGYGEAGTEYTGTLVAGGGGVPLIGPGGLVG